MKKQELNKINRIIRFAMKNKYSDFYRKKYGKKDFVINQQKDFLKIPFLTRDEIVKTPPEKRFFDKFSKANHVKYSSGTSGKEPLIAYSKFTMDEKTFHRGFYLRYSYLRKINRIFILINASSVLRDYLRFGKLLNKLTVVGRIADLAVSAKIANEIKIDTICTTPKRLIRFFPYLKKHYDPDAIKMLQFTNEAINRIQACSIKRKYKYAKWASSYASTEASIIGSQCVYLSDKNPAIYHFDRSGFFFEIIDRRTQEQCRPGELGELAITSLTKGTFVLIRYRTGDLARFSGDSKKTCRCGQSRDNIEVFGSIRQSIFSTNKYELFRDELEKQLIVYCRGLTGNYFISISRKKRKTLKFYFETDDGFSRRLGKEISRALLSAKILFPSGFKNPDEKSAISLNDAKRYNLICRVDVIFKSKIKIRPKIYFKYLSQ